MQNRHAYERWCLNGRQSVMDLLNKFWYTSLPPLGPRPRYHVEHIHADYAVLLRRLMKYEMFCLLVSLTVLEAVTDTTNVQVIQISWHVEYAIMANDAKFFMCL